MPTELAKQLKDAGFPHEGNWYKYGFGGKRTIYIPTLEELIEACGDGFYELVRVVSDEWYATTSNPAFPRGHNLTDKIYLTPKEAVSRLWLALHPMNETDKGENRPTA